MTRSWEHGRYIDKREEGVRTFRGRLNGRKRPRFAPRYIGGCCGSAELIKLESYLLLDYHRVVHLDMDSLLLGESIDELFHMNKSLIYTNDAGMVGKGAAFAPVQGGFLVIKPSRAVYDDLVNIVRVGDFRPGTGWGGVIGWFWGGKTIQGLLPYYYHKIVPPEMSLKVDICEYNNMVDTDKCRAIPLEIVKNVHFTVCQKPWSCKKSHQYELCGKFHEYWFELRRDLESDYGLPSVNACPKGGGSNYVPIDMASVQSSTARLKKGRGWEASLRRVPLLQPK